MCVPHFDGAPLFGRLIGGPGAGTFRVGPARSGEPVRRRYRSSSATLETTWACDVGMLTLTEGMIAEPGRRLMPTTLLVRRLVAEGGSVEVTIDFDPRAGEAHRAPRVEQRKSSLVCTWGSLAVALDTSPAVTIEPARTSSVTVAPGRPLTFVLAVAQREPLVHIDPDAAWAALESDERWWQTWSTGIDAELPFRDPVVRSALTLKLLTFSPSGAPVAAPTTSLPEELGGSRNWDYRYAWPRDASIGVGAFLGVGKDQEARRFLAWLLHASRLDRPRLPVLLTLHGKHARPERILDDWPGYADSRPVRFGNAAADQHQLDNYGWVIDAAWLLANAGHGLYSETWRAVTAFSDLVARRWRDPDSGIWEIRGDPEHHVHSKLMAWLALDRALRIGETHRLSTRRRRRWQLERDAIAHEVRARGFDPDSCAYTRTYGSDDLDASVLILPLLGIEPVASPRIRGTIDAIRRELSAGGPLLYRYRPGSDGVPGSEGAFLPCAFWLAQALATTGRVDEASDQLEALLALASPLGLYSEEMDPTTFDHLGNYPQALTHAALVQAVLALADARAHASAGSRHRGTTTDEASQVRREHRSL